jgi:hypothetical protein
MTHSRLLVAPPALSPALFCFSYTSAQSIDRAQIKQSVVLLWKSPEKFSAPTAIRENRS